MDYVYYSTTREKGPTLKIGKDQTFHDYVEYWIPESRFKSSLTGKRGGWGILPSLRSSRPLL